MGVKRDGGPGRPLDEAVAGLRADQPEAFGYLRRHWRAVRDGVAACPLAYPKARQLHDALEAAGREPDATPRALGMALAALVQLGVVDVWGSADTVGATRYDLTGLDPDCIDAAGRAAEALD
jgi:hypothetical protein